jgi:hypothetical protein
MFVRHMGVALAAKSRAPRAPLGVFVAAAFALDLVWFLAAHRILDIDVVPSTQSADPRVVRPWDQVPAVGRVGGPSPSREGEIKQLETQERRG